MQEGQPGEPSSTPIRVKHIRAAAGDSSLQVVFPIVVVVTPQSLPSIEDIDHKVVTDS